MRIAIAGGNGFLGRALTDELLGADHEIVWLSHRPGRVTPPPSVREVAFNPAEKSGPWRAEVFSGDGVVNLSGYPIASRWDARVKELVRTSRIDTTRALVDAVAEARAGGDGVGPRVFVGASGIGVFGESGDAVLTEDSAAGSDWLAQLAVAWEAESKRAAQSGCRAVTIRNGLALGDEGLLPKLVLPMKLFAGGPVGNGRQWTPWIHTADLVGIYRFALEHGEVSGTIIGCAPEPVTMKQFASKLGRVLHRPSWFPVPGFVLSIVLGEVAPYTLMSQRASSAKIEALGYRFRYPQLEGALRDLL